MVGRFGAREAERGEFSKRAYLNEKITLDQVEVISLGIEAGSIDDLTAMDSSFWVVSQKNYESLFCCENLLVSVEAQLDFSMKKMCPS